MKIKIIYILEEHCKAKVTETTVACQLPPLQQLLLLLPWT